jgi:hypothetical protein
MTRRAIPGRPYAAVLLERAELLKVLVEKKLLERMLDLDLMSPMLDRPELTKAGGLLNAA